ncbi:Uu.00g007230.m01.CDS01 [Anthostomella pinea]|uniref:Uu.00g007230.m01.CDS01 n=1 Tax=Anthostomella pinea TaxID=933095 RepID=A0AAI8YPP0_9PEZI|nr:Uu.00g007230.m01.CDS01 [Anthostomella pinea]
MTQQASLTLRRDHLSIRLGQYVPPAGAATAAAAAAAAETPRSTDSGSTVSLLQSSRVKALEVGPTVQVVVAWDAETGDLP